MKIVITGATGNVGTSVLAALAEEPSVEEIVGLARRKPKAAFAKTRFVSADIATDDLRPHFEGAAAVVHLAWMLQPTRKPELLEAVNVGGSRRVFAAAAAAGVPSIVYASSVGAYAPGPKDEAVAENWPTEGVPTSLYSRQKSLVERQLDGLEREHPRLRIVRLRTALVFKRGAASSMKRYFLGPLFPSWLLSRRRIPFVPDLPALRVQGVHSLDAGHAYRQALMSDAHGAFNIAAEPVLDSAAVARLFDAKKAPMKPRTLRRALELSYRLHLQPMNGGWLDLALAVPIMSVRRAREVLSWRPRYNASEALIELIDGMRDAAGMPTATLEPARSFG